jgi:argininosuccinate lyase
MSDRSRESAASTPARLWGGRFAAEPSAEMDRLNRSLPVDRRLWREDIAGSQAWATALGEAGVVTVEESRELCGGLDRVATLLGSWSAGDWEAAADEDIHSLVERLLRAEVGSVAGKLHTGRSRNDQVATDTRLWATGAILRLDDLLRSLEEALVGQAERHLDTVMPSYTHLQRAQPISAAHWLLSHAWPLSRDRARLADAGKRVSILPLGSGAIAGCPFPVNRELLRDLLDFRDISRNSIDAVSDRDWMAELLFVTAMVGTHLSRLAEDLVLFATAEFGFVRLSDRYSTGSSLMPQKRNPDAMELARGKAGGLIGALAGGLTMLKGLPTGYNKDLQDDKSILFASFDTLETLIPAVAGSVATMDIAVERCRGAVDSAMLATDVADFLVREGIPFREAHEMVGRLVRAAEETNVPLDRLPSSVFTSISPVFEGVEVERLFDAGASLAARAGIGGTAPAAVRKQIEELRGEL